MIKASKFYSSRATPKPRCTTLIEAQDQASRNQAQDQAQDQEIILRSNSSATNDQNSDTENVPDQLVDKDRLFEHADELEVDYSSSE